MPWRRVLWLLGLPVLTLACGSTTAYVRDDGALCERVPAGCYRESTAGECVLEVPADSVVCMAVERAPEGMP